MQFRQFRLHGLNGKRRRSQRIFVRIQLHKRPIAEFPAQLFVAETRLVWLDVFQILTNLLTRVEQSNAPPQKPIHLL